MIDENRFTSLRIPVRDIPVPASISVEAASVLSEAAERGFVWPDYPLLSDVAGWEAYVQGANRNMSLMFGAMASALEGVDVAEHRAGESLYYEVTASEEDATDDRVLVHAHGGALVAGGGELARLSGAALAVTMRAHVYAIDYRTPPRHCHPVPLDDCLAAYAAILERHPVARIVVHGNSAGGNLATAMLLRAQAEGLPMPAALILESPELDLTESGDTFETMRFVDTVLQQGLMPVNRLYAAGHDLADPYLSPLFGDFDPGFPRTLLTAGTRDMFLSNAVRMLHRLRDAHVPAELLVYEAMPHGGFFGTPDDERVRRDLCRFADAAWAT